MQLVSDRYVTDVKHDGRSHRIDIPRLEFFRCEQCGSQVLTDSADEAVGRELRRVAGLLTPDEIRNLRLQFGLTQRLLAELLGVGEATVYRWETGAQIQQRAFDKMLRAYQNVPAFQKYLQAELAVASPA